MLPQVQAWLRNRMSSAADWPVDRLLAAKGETTVNVVLPARNERETVGEIVTAIRRDLMESAPLVDEILVIDSRDGDGHQVRIRDVSVGERPPMAEIRSYTGSAA